MTVHNKTSDEVCAKVHEMRARGVKLDDISDALGMALSTVKNILRGTQRTRSDIHAQSAAFYAQYLALRAEGYSYQDIAEKLGVTKGAVAGYAKRGAEPNYEKTRWKKNRHNPRLSAGMCDDKVEAAPSPRDKPTLPTLKWMNDYYTDQRNPTHAALSPVD
jgi:DNA-binding CsgD family transcriptional regulator